MTGQDIEISVTVLQSWVAAGWLRPGAASPDALTEIDRARARLIRDLSEDLGVNDEGIAIVLDLLDQLHGLRATLRRLLDARAAEP